MSFCTPLLLSLHIRRGLLNYLQDPVVALQRGDLAVLVLGSTFGAEAFGAAGCLRSLVFVLLLGQRKERFFGLVALFSKLAQGSDCGACLGIQSRFELVSFGATAFEAVAELECAAVALAAVFVRRAVRVDAGYHVVSWLVIVC